MTSQDHLAAILAEQMRAAQRDLAARNILWTEYYRRIEGLRVIAEREGLSLAVERALREDKLTEDAEDGSAA